MGSSLSVVNDTADVWSCAVGTDVAGLEIFGIISAVVGSIALVVATAGAAAPYVASGTTSLFVGIYAGTTTITAFNLGMGALSVASVITTSAATVSTSVAAVGAATTIVSSTIAFAMAEDRLEGFVDIDPGQSHKWGPMSLSLWQQAHCKRRTPVIQNDAVGFLEESLFMRPIFSGATDGSTLEHTIQYWLDKHGTEDHTMIQLPGIDPNQPFEWPVFNLVHIDSGKVLDLDHSNCASGTNLHLWESNGGDAQKFTFGENDEIIHVACQKAVDIDWANCSTGTNIKLENVNGHNAQKWSFENTVAGIEVRNPGCNKVLDVSDNNHANGANIQLWDANEGNAQIWKILIVQ